MRDTDADTLVKVMGVLASSGLTQDASLLVLELAWMAQANNIRTAASSFPGGFTAAKATQVDQLQKLVDLVRGDVPDLEQERLWREGNFEGYRQHVLRRLRPDAR